MKYDQQYINQLEKLISTLLPYYYKYHKAFQIEAPPLDVPVHIKPKKPLPALLSGDFRFLPRIDESHETTKNLKQT